MRCPKCGEEYGEGVLFCEACGCDLRRRSDSKQHGSNVYSGEQKNYFEYQQLQPLKEKTGKTKADKKNRFVSVLLMLATLLVVGLAGFFVYSRVHLSDYEKQIDRLVSLINERTSSISDYGELLFPETIWKDMEALGRAQYEDTGRDSSEWEKDANIQMKSCMDYLESVLGNDFQLEYSVVSERKLGREELQDISDSYTKVSQLLNLVGESDTVLKDKGMIKSYEAYGKLVGDFVGMKFSEGYELEVKLTCDSSSGSKNDENSAKLILVRADGKWMIDYMHYIDKLESILGNIIR